MSANDNYRNNPAVKVCKKKKKALLHHLFIRHGGKCHWCKCDVTMGTTSEDAGVPTQGSTDHLKSLWQGRKTYFDGGHVLSCRNCNSARGAAEQKHHITMQKARIKLNLPTEPLDLQRAVNYSSLLLTKGLR